MKMFTYFLLTLSSLCTYNCARHGPAERQSTDSLEAQLLAYMQEERNMLNRLESRVVGLRTQTDTLNDAIVPCSCRISRQPPVAFTGTLAQNYLKGLTANTSFNFTEDLTNIGQSYNFTSGHFVANVSGFYGFSLTIYMTHGYWAAMELVKNGQESVLRVKTGHFQTFKVNRHNNMATNFAVVHLSAGDDVSIKYLDSSDGTLYAGGVTTLSGVLLYAT